MEHVVDALGIESAKEAEVSLRSLLAAVSAVPAAFQDAHGCSSHSLAQVEAEIRGDWRSWVRDVRKATGEVVGKCHDISVEVRTLVGPSADKPNDSIKVQKYTHQLAINQWHFDQAIGDIERTFSKTAARLEANEALRVAGEKAELASVLCGPGHYGHHVPEWKYDRQDLLNKCREKVSQAIGTIRSQTESGLRTLQMVWEACERARLQNAEVRLLVASQRPVPAAQLSLPPVVNVEPVVHVAPPTVNVTVTAPPAPAQELPGAPYSILADKNGKPCLTWNEGSRALRPAIRDFLAELNDKGAATARMEYVNELLEAVPVLKPLVQQAGKRGSDGRADYNAPSLKGRVECGARPA